MNLRNLWIGFRLKRNCLFSPELKLAVFVLFSFSQTLAGGYPHNMCKDAGPDFIDSFRAVYHPAGRKIQIVTHAGEHRRVEASLITGAIALPMVVPRPVVKTITVAPAATNPGVDS